MRWVSEKTGRVVAQVQPNAVVRLEFDGPAPPGAVIRIVEEPEPTLKTLLRALGRKTRRTVTTLRWDVTARVTASGLRSEPFHAVHLPPPETITRLVAQVETQKSPPLLVGRPVQVTFAETVGTDAKLGAPLVPGTELSLGGQRTRSREVRCTAYGAIDPLVSIRALLPSEGLFGRHFARTLEETGFVSA